jgi:hypothetical protein
MRPPLGSLRRRVTSDNYGRKLKPAAKKTRKIRQKTKKTLKNARKKGTQKLQIRGEIMVVAALLALGMLAIMPGMIAGSALTESAKQVPNVITQVSFAYCGYRAYTGDSFLGCMGEFWLPAGAILGTSAAIGASYVTAGKALDSWYLINTGLRYLKFTKVGFKVAVV